MSSELERLVVLVTSANVYLNNDEDKYNMDPAITEYCHGVEFIENPLPGVAGSMRTIAPNAERWFMHLKQEGPARVRLHYHPFTRDDIPQRIRDVVTEYGSNWLIETQYNKLNRLYVQIMNSQKLSIPPSWKKFFVLLEGGSKNLDDTSPSVQESIDNLDRVLEMLSNFADRFEYTKHWADNFASPRQILHDTSSSSIDLIPNGIYSNDAYHLLQAALSSWVFGGMGSWNDLAFNGDDDTQYASLTGQLYETICTSIVSVVNSYP